MFVRKAKARKGIVTYTADLKESEYLQLLGQSKQQDRSFPDFINDYLSKFVFYGKALNDPSAILELKFVKLDFRPDDHCLLIHFKIVSGSWGDGIMYDVFSYGKSFSLCKEDLM